MICPSLLTTSQSESSFVPGETGDIPFPTLAIAGGGSGTITGVGITSACRLSHSRLTLSSSEKPALRSSSHADVDVEAEGAGTISMLEPSELVSASEPEGQDIIDGERVSARVSGL